MILLQKVRYLLIWGAKKLKKKIKKLGCLLP